MECAYRKYMSVLDTRQAGQDSLLSLVHLLYL